MSHGNLKEKVVARDAFETVDLDDEQKTTESGPRKDSNNLNPVQQLGATSRAPANGKTCNEDNDDDDSELRPPFLFAGIIGTIASSTFFSLSLLCVKLLPDSDSLQEKTKAVWFRGLLIAFLSSMTLIAQGTTFKIKRNEIWLNIARVGIGFFGAFGSFTSLQFITLGESTALVYLSIVWIAILSYTILKEPFPMTLIFAIPMAMFGILLIAHPDLILDESAVEGEVLSEVVRHNHTLKINNTIVAVKGQFNRSLPVAMHSHSVEITRNSSNSGLTAEDFIEVDPDIETQLYFEQRWPGILIAIGTSFISSIVFVILKHRQSTPIQTCNFYLGVGTVVMSTCIQCGIGFGRWPMTLMEWLPLLGMGFFSWCGQALMQWSLQYEKASILSVVKTVDLVLSFCWSTFFLDEDVLWTSLVGASIILVIVVILVLNDRLEQLMCSRCKKQ